MATFRCEITEEDLELLPIPFVLDRELMLSCAEEEEVAAIALALFLMTTESTTERTPWINSARFTTR